MNAELEILKNGSERRYRKNWNFALLINIPELVGFATGPVVIFIYLMDN